MNHPRGIHILVAIFVVLCACVGVGIAFGADCPSAPLGLPMIAGTELVCHPGYASLLDPKLRETRLVTYQLTAAHSVAGCIPRTGLTFKPDPLAPAGAQGKASDYAAAGYDLGHMANNEDFAWDKTEQADTFSMANVEPQLPGLNRQGWERGEEFVRAWAFGRGALDIFVGPIFGPNPKTIGADKLPVPIAFFKIVYTEAVQGGFVSSIAFEMKQENIAKMADLTPWIVSIDQVRKDSGIDFPVILTTQAVTAWAADLTGWRNAHAAACH